MDNLLKDHSHPSVGNKTTRKTTFVEGCPALAKEGRNGALLIGAFRLATRLLSPGGSPATFNGSIHDDIRFLLVRLSHYNRDPVLVPNSH